MSEWTFINGIITVEPMGRTQSEKRYILETVLNHLPRVSGSEGNMNTYIIQKNGFNCSSSCDEFRNRSNLGNGRSYRYPLFRTQSHYFIVVNGDLRDRELSRTVKEFMKWLCRLGKRISIEKILVNIEGYENSVTINDDCDFDSPYVQMFQNPSWVNDEGEDRNWCEYMMWDWNEVEDK